MKNQLGPWYFGLECGMIKQNQMPSHALYQYKDLCIEPRCRDTPSPFTKLTENIQ